MLWFVFVVLAQAGPVPAPELVGKWHASGQVPGDPKHGPGMSWQVDYDFRPDGTFVMTGYPPISVTGKLKIVAREKERLHVVLYDRKMGGSSWPDLDDWAVFSDGGNQMTLDKKDFRRVKP